MMHRDYLFDQLLDRQRPSLEKSLDAETPSDQRPYASFAVSTAGSQAVVAGFHYKVVAKDEGGDFLDLPAGIDKFFAENEAAHAVKLCLEILALGKTKYECDLWSQHHKKED